MLLLFVLALGASSGSSAATGVTFTVNSTGDAPDASIADGICADATGNCTLRAAITQSNASVGSKDTIAFGIPGSGPHLIVVPPVSSFPFVTDAVVVDGTTQPGYAGTPLVEIDVSAAGPFALLVIGNGSAGTEIRGLAIYGDDSGNDFAIDFDNPGGNVVERNYIGTTAGGTVAKGFGGVAFRRAGSGDGLASTGNTVTDNLIGGKGVAGVQFEEVVDSRVVDNLIGTDVTGAQGISAGQGVGISLTTGSSRNLLAGNVIADRSRGIRIFGSTGFPSADNRIEGNRIGTDVTGTVDLGNVTVGIDVGGLAPGTIIGGADPAARNVISGNDGGGTFLAGSLEGTIVQGNLVGTDVTGTLDLGNGGVGVAFSQTAGLIRIVGNVISGNASAGMSGGAAPSGSVRIEGNLIGTNAQGTVDVGNTGDGISLSGNLVDSVVGGDTAAQRNVVSGNGGNGVSVGTPGLEVLGNYIGTDASGGHDLGNDGDGVHASDGTILGKPGAGNVISGNGGAGVRPSTCCSGDLVIQANLIGTDASGKLDIGNDGSGIFFNASRRLRIGGAGSGEANVVSGNGRWGVEIGLNGGDNLIEGNRIGTDVDGVAAIPNDLGGLTIAAPFLGTTDDVVDNLISGNGGDGIRLQGGPHRVLGNLIGIDRNGGSGLGNAGNGINIVLSSAGGNAIGDTGAGNVIAGNRDNGLLVSSTGNRIAGNRIGTDVAGGAKLANGLSGIRLEGNANRVEANVVSGNGADGIELAGPASGQLILANLVGTGADGTSALGNARHGISIDGAGSLTTHTIGGQAGDGNTIAFNGGHGVLIRRAHLNSVQRNAIFSNGGDGVAIVGGAPQGAIRNWISANAISANAGLGIDLQDDGVTANDAGDGDGGSGFFGLANFLQNFPVNLQVSDDRTTVTGTLNSRPSTTYRIELFGNSPGVACDPSGNGEGETYLEPEAPGATEVTTNGSGDATFSVRLKSPLSSGDVVSATATELGAFPGNTSEFSPCVTPPQLATIVVRKATDPRGDPAVFEFTGDAAGRIADGGTITVTVPAPGTYTSRELVPSGWDLTGIVCNDADSSGTVASATATFRVVPDERVTCTFTDTKRGSVTLRKTTNGVVDPTKDICFVLRGQGAPVGLRKCTFGDPDGVLEWPNLAAGQYSMCESPVPAGFTSFWRKDGEIVIPYNPDASRTPPEDLGDRCYDFSLTPGRAVAFDVDNARPGGDPRTIGYWKNWNRCTGGNQTATAEKNGGAAAGFFLVEDLLPQLIGDFTVADCQQAVKLLSKQDQAGKSKSSDAVYELGAQLLAARLNLGAGAETCAGVQQAVLDGQALLDGINFTGSGDYLGSKSKDTRRTQALSLAATLDRYNNGNVC
ncbi:MAG TPA: right-handed parallel beta-helix repeat-containing protein [Gaiellaceae bacterium]|nr:right-handed parallel beta-helix repeat-containing protein [Gaiellaceae bacterium]